MSGLCPSSTRLTNRRHRRDDPGYAGGGGGPTDHQTLLVRRAIALGAGLLFFILLVVVVNGCLDSRKERALKDYNRNVGALIQQDDEQVGKGASSSSPTRRPRRSTSRPA